MGKLDKRVTALEQRVEEFADLKDAIGELTSTIDGLCEYLASDVVKRAQSDRTAYLPAHRKVSTRKGKSVAKVTKAKAKLAKLGCEFEDGKNQTKVLVNGKKLAVIKSSGRIERKVKVDGVTGWQQCSLKKLLKIAKKRMK